MKATRLIVLGLAVAAAGGAGYIATQMSAPPAQVVQEILPIQPTIAMEDVLVATRDIEAGDTIADAEAFRWQPWPRDTLTPEGYIIRSQVPEAQAELVGRLVRQTIFAGEPVRNAKLVDKGQNYMAVVLPKGKRAVATQISVDTSAGGFILPNDRVDVIMARRNPQTGAIATEVILENIRVLAIDQTIRQNEQGQLVQVGQTATLELSPQQSQIITVAQQLADRLTLTLRSIQDVKAPETPGAEYLLGGGGGGKGGTVTVIKSGEMTKIGGN